MAYLDVAGKWWIRQSNGASVLVTIEQNGGDLTGSAIDYQVVGSPRSMEARGSVTDREFTFDVSWNNGTRGRYTATLQSNGRLAGFTFDAMHPNSQATWVSDREFALSKQPAPAATDDRPPVGKPPIRAMGRPRRSPPAADRVSEQTTTARVWQDRAIREQARTPRLDPHDPKEPGR